MYCIARQVAGKELRHASARPDPQALDRGGVGDERRVGRVPDRRAVEEDVRVPHRVDGVAQVVPGARQFHKFFKKKQALKL